MKYITLHGLRFCRDGKSGYYRNGTVHKLAHRYVWECERGPIPPDHHIHHVNHDRGDNRIENLECIHKSEHLSRHHAEEGWTTKMKRAQWFKNIRPKAMEWHSSPAGLEWHKNHAIVSLAAARERHPRPCTHCGKETLTNRKGQAFCSNACKSAYRRASGVDDAQFQCGYCRQTYTANKYSKAVTCSRACANRQRDSVGVMRKAT